MTMFGDDDPQFGGDDRAQTAQDFAVGISIFLLVVGSVFVFFPSLFTPYEAAIAKEDVNSQSDRVAIMIADNATDDRTVNRLTETETDYWFGKDGEELREAVGMASTSQVNVTLTTLGTDDESPVELASGDAAAAGHEYDSTSDDAAATARIVTIEDGTLADPSECEPACRLIVRVW